MPDVPMNLKSKLVSVITAANENDLTSTSRAFDSITLKDLTAGLQHLEPPALIRWLDGYNAARDTLSRRTLTLVAIGVNGLAQQVK